MKKHIIQLQAEQRQELEALMSCGQAPARKIKHAQILLKSEQGWSDKQIMHAFDVGETMIWRVRRRYVEQGLGPALNRCPQPERPEKRKVSGEAEAHLIALACTKAPEGYERWSVRLLTKTAIELEIVAQVGRETVRQVLKKMSSNPGSKSNGAFHLSTRLHLSTIWKMCLRCTKEAMIHNGHKFVWTKEVSNC